MKLSELEWQEPGSPKLNWKYALFSNRTKIIYLNPDGTYDIAIDAMIRWQKLDPMMAQCLLIKLIEEDHK